MNNSESQICEVCGAYTNQLRRGRCWICYLRWAEMRPVGKGAVCVICWERRQENLRLVEYQEAWLPMCHNCSAKVLSISPPPASLESLRQQLARDRRWKDRRQDISDMRLLPFERRSTERRNDSKLVEDWQDAEQLIIESIEILDEPLGFGEEATRIKSHFDEPASKEEESPLRPDFPLDYT